MKILRILTGLALPLILLGAIAAAAAWNGFLPRGSPFDYFAPQDRFIRHWRSALQHCADPSAAQVLLKQNKEGGEAVTMADGSWVAVVMEHECCTGAGFNATLYITSTGETYLDPESCYCGWLELGGEIYGHPKTGIAGFLEAVRRKGKKLTRL